MSYLFSKKSLQRPLTVVSIAQNLDYYQDFYDAFGDNADFMVATLNFQDYYDHLESDQAKLGARIVKLQADLEANPKSEKKQNQLKSYQVNLRLLMFKRGEATAFIDKYGQEDIVLAGSLLSIHLKKLFIFLAGLIQSLISFMRQHSCKYVMTPIKRGITF